MKKIISCAAALLVLFGSVSSVLPQGAFEKGIIVADAGFEENGTQYGDYYAYESNGGLVLTGYAGATIPTALNIPGTISGKSVVGISTNFNNDYYLRSTVTSVTIPDTVTFIDEQVFQGYSKLESVTLSNSLKKISDSTFASCKALKSITIPESVTAIGDYAFTGCTALTEITVPKSVASIGTQAIGYNNGVVMSTLTLYCYSGSEANNYAVSNKLSYKLIDMPDHVHSYTATVTQAATCTLPEITTYTCSCGDTYTQQTAKSKGHTFKTEVIAPTTTSEGYTLHTCTVCGYSYKSNKTSMLTEDTTNLSSATVTVVGTYTYTGAEITPSAGNVRVTLNGKTLTNNTDYTFKCSNNKNVGTATVTITGAGSYTGSASGSFKINQASLSNAAISGINSSYTYTGSAITPTPAVALGGVTLSSSDYMVSYSSNNTAAGNTVTVTITGKNNCTGSKTATFTITAQTTARIAGDANDDKQVTVADVLLIQQKLAKWNVTINESNADVTGDGQVTVADVLLIQQKLAKWNVTLK